MLVTVAVAQSPTQTFVALEPIAIGSTERESARAQ